MSQRRELATRTVAAVRVHDATKPGNLPDSPYARELRLRFMRLRFAPAIESEFATSHLRRARGRVRAWHSTVLAVLLSLVLPVLLTLHSGADSGVFAGTWSHAGSDVLLFALMINIVSRTVLVIVAWSPWFERVYPRIAFPLVAVCHGFWTFACSSEIFGAHPEYLAPLVTDAFAAYFFSGLLFRQALVVNIASTAGLLLGGWYFTAALAPILSFGMHFSTNIVMAAIAGFAHERSSRGLFLEHSLLGEMAMLDGLTGLKNRRAFDEHFARAWQQGLRDGRPLAILMIDVDQFKNYNDCYGHQAGDRALQQIADLVNGLAKRPLDNSARYGGEELAIVLYDPVREEVVELAERLQRGVHGLAIEHRDSSAGVVTISIGVSIVYPTPNRSPQGALQLADQALYDAKSEGRNRIKVLENEYHSLSTGVFRTAVSAG